MLKALKRWQRDMSRETEVRRFEVGAPWDRARLDCFLAAQMRWRSRVQVQELIASGAVVVRRGKDPKPLFGTSVRASRRLRRGQEVEVILAAAWMEGELESPALRDQAAREIAGIVVYEDEHLLAVNKPPLVSVYPSPRHRQGSLVERVHRWWRLEREGPVPSPCHRLDRETSGLLVFAKHRQARAEIGRQLEAREVEKTYLAVVARGPEGNTGVVDLPIGPDPTSKVAIKMCARSGLVWQARTEWKVLARGSDSSVAGASRTVLELRPRTGRQHQLRVHLAAIGCPIVGDKLYFGGDALFLASLAEDEAVLPEWLGHPRLALHAHGWLVRHPAGGHHLNLVAPLSRDLRPLVSEAGVTYCDGHWDPSEGPFQH